MSKIILVNGRVRKGIRAEPPKC